jgi:antitoxin component YwqK of YwqJK toxin-antitoxin module
MKVWLTLFLIIVLNSCYHKDKEAKKIIRVDTNWLDSIKRKSDTSWIKPYRNNEFVTSEYYIDKKDSIVTQLMKDSAGAIRQIIIAKYDNIRLFFAEYYANGQLKASLQFDSTGKYNGQAKYYYQNGQVKSEGIFVHGFFSGQWKNYDEKGKFISKDEYDENGQLIKTTKN